MANPDHIRVLGSIWPESTCSGWMRHIDHLRPHLTKMSTPRRAVRRSGRVILHDEKTAAALMERARARLPASIGRADLVGANECIRCYRYEVGDFFAEHTDGCFVRDEAERSIFTFIVYLNDDFAGGELVFPQVGLTVYPSPGLGVVFPHRLLHESRPIVRGTKYALRTDLMYRRPKRAAPTPSVRVVSS